MSLNTLPMTSTSGTRFCQILFLVCHLLLFIPFALPADPPSSILARPVPNTRQDLEARKVAQSAVRSLSGAQLMQEYSDPGHVLSLAPYAVLSHSQSPYIWKLLLFESTKKEIVQRGTPMVTLLADFLTKELPKRRLAPTPALSGVGRWYDTETISLLAQIRSPSSAQALLALLAGDGKKPAFEHGDEAEGALETLTYCCYYKSGSNFLSDGLTVPRLDADDAPPNFSKNSDFEAVAAFYRQWLAGEGKDSSQWLPSARHRAHRWLKVGDLVIVDEASLFLADHGAGPTE